MNRYYLDTNILVFLLEKRSDEISKEVGELIMDYENLLFTSTVCVHELIHLSQIGKLHIKRKGKNADISEFSQWLDEMSIKIVPVTVQNLQTYSTLPLFDEHRDPNDRLIIAQAISDKIALVSSDRKFDMYEKYGLEFVFNRR
ncbi:type II toxin-antitoxin system VapC family toxin [Prevotella lacticifex]|jgi:PIN domain nuclease of toxin-antitoxin system|uniref:Twitching motility protein PilT n=1 Tax=Prevotella lacticifex TaxID=2854755 RepID=A0A9R1C7P1_9BACT|nr:type II toxin-antitoxin system VapC family toxin [Prevotella lacticifex]GJG37299.1 twitching motility protein PilT [Prevotella lacticifex]GJG40201.1 twitching motility protein PilT [Prevotella lacticifex]GJG43896.1 twitching motility protein PilT [Prevotella lacticifex]GJG46579.1 twitching motility protein PilT [Prevotella lacticifex]GJG49670.1 twitching motility protein PilT [Prevotella lacticifex]